MKKGSTSPLFRVGWIFEPLHDKDWLNQRYLHYTDQQFNTYMISSIYCDDVWQITKWKITFQNDLQKQIRTLMSYDFPFLYKLIYYLYLRDSAYSFYLNGNRWHLFLLSFPNEKALKRKWFDELAQQLCLQRFHLMKYSYQNDTQRIFLFTIHE